MDPSLTRQPHAGVQSLQLLSTLNTCQHLISGFYGQRVIMFL
jgi:hypothetical protein